MSSDNSLLLQPAFTFQIVISLDEKMCSICIFTTQFIE